VIVSLPLYKLLPRFLSVLDRDSSLSKKAAQGLFYAKWVKQSRPPEFHAVLLDNEIRPHVTVAIFKVVSREPFISLTIKVHYCLAGLRALVEVNFAGRVFVLAS